MNENLNSEQLYYKVENKDCDLYKRANEFLAMEEKLRETQRKTIESELPKFSKGFILKIKGTLTLKSGKQKKKMG